MSTRMIPTGTDAVRIEVTDRVGIITFARPERRNALSDEMYAPMIAAVESFAADPAVGCVVVTGEGSAFCSGGDVRDGSGRRPGEPKPTLDDRAAALAANARLSVVLREAPVITIAAVNGPAVGAGMAIALACDLRIAVASATFIGGWARLGFSGDFGGGWLLARRVGEARALEILASNRAVGAEEALSLTMVERVVRDDEFDTAWRDWAATFAAGPQTAIGFMKRNVANSSTMPLAEAIAIESSLQVQASQTADHREAVRAWIDKRAPRFGG